MSKNLITLDTSGQPVASSLDIAEHFGKEHKNVLQSIENLTAENSALTQMFFHLPAQSLSHWVDQPDEIRPLAS